APAHHLGIEGARGIHICRGQLVPNETAVRLSHSHLRAPGKVVMRRFLTEMILPASCLAATTDLNRHGFDNNRAEEAAPADALTRQPTSCSHIHLGERTKCNFAAARTNQCA